MALNIAHALTVGGYMSEIELRWLAEQASKSKIIVEIGSWMGRSACSLAANTKGILICVDTWSGSLEVHDGFDAVLFTKFRKNTEMYNNIWPMPFRSVRAAEILSSLGIQPDMIFIDGDHTSENVRADILAWRPLLAEGGIFAGHDYLFPNWPDVQRVVNELVVSIDIIDTIWCEK